MKHKDFLASSKFLVVPCYNEAKRLAPPEFWNTINENAIRLVFVDDASNDSTSSKINQLNLSDFRLITLKRNVGKANAIRTGFLSITSQMTENSPTGENILVGYVDADGAFAPDDVIEMFRLGEKGSFDAVFASRVRLAGREIHRSRIRHFVGRFIITFLSSTKVRLPYDTQAGLKVFRYTPIIRECLSRQFNTRWFFELEIFLRFHSIVGKPIQIWEEPLRYWKETKGSKVISIKSISLLSQIITLFLQLLRLSKKI